MAKRIDDRVNTVSPEQYLKFAQELVVADRDIRKATEVLAQARGVKAGVFRRAKEAGADVEAMRSLADLKRMDNDDRNRLLETVYKYAEWEGVPLWVQPTAEKPQGQLFDPDSEAGRAHQGLVDARAYSDGYNVARDGGSSEHNRHEPGSSAHERWAKGYKDGQESLGGKLPASTASAARKPGKVKDPAPAAPTRPRGRPRKGAVQAPVVN
jgi:uncharacterized protein (UPF0335 family)